MLGVFQFRTGTACVALALLVGLAVSPQTTIEPIVDHRGACAYCDVVSEAFARAEDSIELLLGDAELQENPLWNGLIAAHERGVEVRVLLDESDWSSSITAKNLPASRFLSEHGVLVRFDDPAITLHAKMVLVDRREAILGSTNWNRYAFTDQTQANVRIDDARVAGALAEAFDRLWNEQLPEGGLSLPAEAIADHAPTIVPLLDTDGTAMYGTLLLDRLRRAERSIHMVMYRMSVYVGYMDSLCNQLIDAVVRAARRGLDVRILLDDCRFYFESAEANLMSALYLREQGIDVRFDAPEETTHAKLVVIDGETLFVGSTNWNYYSLERNVEANVAILHMPQVAASYEAFFEQVWSEGRSVGL